MDTALPFLSSILGPDIFALVQVIFIDLIMAGDNAIIVGMAAGSLPAEQRRKAILFGILAATILRISFAIGASQLMQVIGLTLAGGLLLLWVAWKFWREIRLQSQEDEAALAVEEAIYDEIPKPHHTGPKKTFGQAIFQIIIADASMSLDNVIAVAGIARHHTWVLVVGLVFSIAFMAFAASLIASLLQKYRWIAYLGLLAILYVALKMIYDGSQEVLQIAQVI